jgi:hypothetical protein
MIIVSILWIGIFNSFETKKEYQRVWDKTLLSKLNLYSIIIYFQLFNSTNVSICQIQVIVLNGVIFFTSDINIIFYPEIREIILDNYDKDNKLDHSSFVLLSFGKV